MKYVLVFAIMWETAGTLIVPCPGSLPTVNVSTINTVSYQYVPACVEIKREVNKSKSFDTRVEAEKYLKAKKILNGQVVEIK